MSFFLIVPYYLYWHYSQALSDIKNIWKNLIIFIYHFFSIPVLIFTLFSPFERIKDGYGKGSPPIYETIIFNTLMRLVGAVTRIIFIITGIVCIFVIFVMGIVIIALWIALPVVLVGCLSWGFKQMFG